ncbi:TPA: HTH-type transcriptional regulator YidZ [Escherichia coli]
MSRFLICSFALVLLYPAGIDMYLVGLPRIAADLNASEAQLHIAFSVYLAGMAAAMLFAGKVADRSGRKPVAIPGAALFIIASVFCSLAETSTLFLAGRFLQGLGAGCCYVVAFAILRDTLDDRRRAKVLSLLNGITCIIPVLAPVLGHLIMLKFPWQSLFWAMAMMGIAVLMLSLFILKETRPAAPAASDKPRENSESLLNRFFLSRVVITTLSVSVILTFVNTSPVLLMEIMGFERGEYATIMALTAGVSMTVSFSTPFALGIFKPRTLMITSQVLFLAAGITLAVSPSHAVSLFGITLMMIMLNALSKQIYQRYPQATIKLRNWDYDSLDAITRGEVDIGFSGRESHPRSRELLSSLPLAIDYEVLFSDVPCVWLRKDHPALHQTWNLDTFLRYPHISICWEQSDTWALDNVLQELGRERTIAMSLPEFEQSLFMAAQPDNLLLATAPRYCQYYNQLHQLPLVALPLPFDESQQKKLEVPFTLLWHKRNSHNPKIVWLRETIKNLYASMA